MYSLQACYGKNGFLGPTSASTFNQHWRVLQTLYPLMQFSKEWKKPKVVRENPIGEEPIPESGFICDINFSSDGRKMLAGSSIGDIHLFDPNLQKCVSTMNASQYVLRVCFTGDTQFASGQSDSSILLWDLRNTKVPFNSLLGHSKLIRGLEYDGESHQLISTSYDGQLRYWHIPSYQVERIACDNAETTRYRGVLFKCPNLEHMSVSWQARRMVFANSKGTIFSISNLDLDHLNEDLGLVRFDNSLPLLLSWITPNASTHRRNAIRIMEGIDYNPHVNSSVSRLHHVLLHPHLPLFLVRFCTTTTGTLEVSKRDWLSLYNLQEMMDVSQGLSALDTARAYGADIMCEPLLYNMEVSRYCVLLEKKVSFSRCGRVIASPDKNGIVLMSFDSDLDFPKLTTRNNSISDLFEPDRYFDSKTPDLHTVLRIPRGTNAVMCTKFSESGNGLLLTAGEKDGKVSFHLPKV